MRKRLKGRSEGVLVMRGKWDAGRLVGLIGDRVRNQSKKRELSAFLIFKVTY